MDTRESPLQPTNRLQLLDRFLAGSQVGCLVRADDILVVVRDESRTRIERLTTNQIPPHCSFYVDQDGRIAEPSPETKVDPDRIIKELRLHNSLGDEAARRAINMLPRALAMIAELKLSEDQNRQDMLRRIIIGYGKQISQPGKSDARLYESLLTPPPMTNLSDKLKLDIISAFDGLVAPRLETDWTSYRSDASEFTCQLIFVRAEEAWRNRIIIKISKHDLSKPDQEPAQVDLSSLEFKLIIDGEIIVGEYDKQIEGVKFSGVPTSGAPILRLTD